MIRRNCFVAGVLAVALLGWVADGQAQDWRNYKSSEGRFSIDVPVPPKQTKTVQESFIGSVTNHIFTSLHDDSKYTVDYSEIPSFAVDFAGADTIIDHAKGAVAMQTMAKVKSSENISVGKYKGKKFVFELPKHPGKPQRTAVAYIVLVGDRLYVVDAEVPVSEGPDDTDRFLKSLSFID